MKKNIDLPSLGQGVYGISDAAHLIGTSTQNLRRWLEPDSSLVHRAYAPEEGVISFLELMELHFIKMFRDEGVSLQAIRVAADAAARRYRVDYPFAVKRFDTDGRTIFATLANEADDQQLVEDLRRGQYVFSTIIRPFFRKLEYDTTEVSRFWPRGKSKRVVLDPRRKFGRPIDSRTGVPTRTLYDAFKAGGGQRVESIANWFDVPVSAVRAAVEFEESPVS